MHHSTNETVKMLSQQYGVITNIDSPESTHIKPLLIQLQKTDKLGICRETVGVDSVLSSYGMAKGDRFKLSIPYAKQNLTWNVFFDSECPEMGPDFIFNDDAFLANMDVDTFSTNVPSLANWNPNDGDALLNVLAELLSCYKQYQIQLLQKQERLQLEYTMLMQSGEVKPEDVEMVLLPLASKPTEARFLVSLTVDVSKLPHRTCESKTDVAMLLVTYRGPDWNYITPQLQFSKSLENIFVGPNVLRLPHFLCDTFLADYVLEIKKCIAGKINSLVQSLDRRRLFLAAMIGRLYGSQLEYDAINFTYLAQLLSKRNFEFILHIQLPPEFPKEQPIFRLRSVYHCAEDGSPYTEVLKNCPYNQQVKPQNMADKIVKYILNRVDEFMINSVRLF
ncbi:BRISC and BRCA1-A complex member 2 [Andrena cerasifolii]|uniref:BRISC and BRCA1-A complex member 2 n=1 Tax=Andrena cerasifolii TaxID=2819439 RepID=UPI00403798D1